MTIVSRIYLKVLWLKKTYSFNWAHKPLCEKYQEDTIKIKHIHLCRSCVFVYLGMLTSLALFTTFDNIASKDGYLLLCTLFFFTLSLSHPVVYKKLPRLLRDLLRYSLGFLILQTFFMALQGHFFLAACSCLLLSLFRLVYYQKRAQRKLEKCYRCEEYSDSKVCSGYHRQTLLIREYEEEATEYIIQTGYIPKINKNNP